MRALRKVYSEGEYMLYIQPTNHWNTLDILCWRKTLFYDYAHNHHRIPYLFFIDIEIHQTYFSKHHPCHPGITLILSLVDDYLNFKSTRLGWLFSPLYVLLFFFMHPKTLRQYWIVKLDKILLMQLISPTRWSASYRSIEICLCMM